MSRIGHIERNTVAEAWQALVIKIWKRGRIDPKYGKEMSLVVKIKYPFKEPRFHPGDLNAVMGMKKYLGEILEGTLDWAVKAKKVSYTYHDRLTNYPSLFWANVSEHQIESLIRRLKREKEHTNRNLAITWIPSLDTISSDPPCLQMIWCKNIRGKLVMHTTWRSRDGFRAWNMNVLALTELQKFIAEAVGLKVGSYIDYSTSVHLYKKTWDDVVRFLKVMERRKLYE